jgi:type I restriction enzyme M protein
MQRKGGGQKELARRPKNHSQANTNPANQSIITSPDEHLDISMLETWLWDAACAIRGSTDAPKFKDFILPLVFFKRLSDVLNDEFTA